MEFVFLMEVRYPFECLSQFLGFPIQAKLLNDVAILPYFDRWIENSLIDAELR